MPSTMTALKAAAILAFPIAQAADTNIFAGYEGYTEECTSCYSNKLVDAFSPVYVEGDNPLVAVCASGNNKIFSECDAKCIDKFGHSFRQNKCAGSHQKRDSACDICWKSVSQEQGCLTPFVIAGNEYNLAQCLCQPGKVDAFHQKCDSLCTTGGMSPSTACGMVGVGKRNEATLTTVTTVTVQPQTTPCNSTTSAVVAPTTTGKPCPYGYKSCYTTAEGGLCILPEMWCPGTPNPLGPVSNATSTSVVAFNSTLPFASGTIGVPTSTDNITVGQATETAPISNGASTLGNFSLLAAGVIAAAFMFA